MNAVLESHWTENIKKVGLKVLGSYFQGVYH